MPVCPELTINNRQVALDLVRRGHGSALLLSVSVKAELERGTLIRMNTRYSFGFVVARLIALDKKPSRATKFFLDFLAGNGALENKDNPG